MARRRDGDWKVWGPGEPEQHHGRLRWRVVVRGPTGRRKPYYFRSEREAKTFRSRQLRRLVGEMTFGEALDHYERYLKVDRGNKPRSVSNTISRLKKWLPVDEPLSAFTAGKAERRYEERTDQVKADTHRNELAKVKTFGRWLCHKKRQWLPSSPFEEIEPIGSRNTHGKLQLRPGEADRFLVTGMEMADKGDEGALAAVLTLILGPRSDEVLSLFCRDIDPTFDGRVFVCVKWVEQGKTRSAKRAVEVKRPELAQALLRQITGRQAEERLFAADSKTGYRSPSWLRKVVRRVCEKAGVTVVCPHGLRGSRATLYVEGGKDLHQVSRDLGHASP